jgi:zinc protease
MTLNRQQAPSISAIADYTIKEAEKHTLSNGIEVYSINAGTETVLKLEIVFNGGIIQQQKKCQASFTAQLISEGTSKYSAAEIAEKLDYYGAYFQAKSSYDDSSISLYCLSKYLDESLPFIIEILTDAIFPEADLAIHQKNSIQKLIVNEQKNTFLVRRAFNQHLFGLHNNYGSSADINAISRTDLAHFYQNNYQNGIKYITVAGLLQSNTLSTIAKYFDHKAFKTGEISAIQYSPKTYAAENIFIEKPESVQNALRIGKKHINRNHADFRQTQLLNLILGGYFGSRLMKNIREEKGLTYGIYSAIETRQYDAAWYIETEINNNLYEQGLSEILKEIKTLRENLIPEEELSIAKNYLLGSFLRNTEGPFNLADRFKILKDYHLSYQYFYEFLAIVKDTNAIQLRELANKYLNENELSIVIVGNKK